MKIKTKLLIMGTLPIIVFLITGTLLVLLNLQKNKALQRTQAIDSIIRTASELSF